MTKLELEPFDPVDISTLETRHKEVMLDLILTWAKLDGDLGILLSYIKGFPLPKGVDEFGSLPTWMKFKRIIEVGNEDPAGRLIAKFFRRHKKQYEKHSLPRDRIAHANCVGIWTKQPDYIVFLPFQLTSDGDMAIDRVPIAQMQRAIRWGTWMHDVTDRIINRIAPDA